MTRYVLTCIVIVGVGFFSLADENTLPDTSAPAITISSLPQNIQLIVGMTDEDYYQPRVDAIHSLEYDLPEEQIKALMDFLFTKIENQRLPDLEFNGLKNELTWALIRQHQQPVDLAQNLVKMYKDRTYDVTWRDYCVQFCGKNYPYTASKDDKEIMIEALFNATKERDNRIAGTAAYMLCQLTKTQGTRKDKVADAAYEAISDPVCDNVSKVSLLQAGAELGDIRFLPAARDLAKNARDIPLRMSAIAAVGFLGDATDLDFLASLTQINDIRIQKPALAAIERIQSK